MLFVTIILDGVGIGEQPDASDYDDVGSDTLGHILQITDPHLPNLQRLGLGNIKDLRGVAPNKNSSAAFGKMRERSAGKDSTTGHWELAGILLANPFPTYPDGFPGDVLKSFCEGTGSASTLGNRAESGTVIIEEFGAEHIQSGNPIVYTSADSVFQIAAHIDVIALEKLYEMCKFAREVVCVGQHAVGRVIARPFSGSAGSFHRLSGKRKDFSRLPHAPTLQEALRESGVKTVSVGKVADLFGGVGFESTTKTGSNAQGIEVTRQEIRTAARSGEHTFIWVNLIDFDQEYGHRLDPEGFARSLEEFDEALPSILNDLPTGARLILTADHGNDPTMDSSDHSREYVPLLYYGDVPGSDLGTRSTFADHAASVADYFGVTFPCEGTSFEASSN